MEVTTDMNHSVTSSLNRFEMFQILLRNALQEVSSGVSQDDYIKLFGGLSALKNSRSAPMKMHKTMKTKLLESLNSEIEQMVEEEQMESKCNQLDQLVEECALFEGRETWRPNGNVNDHVRSHVMEKKLKHKCALEEYVRDKEHATEMLEQKVLDLRAQLHEAGAALNKMSELDTSIIERMDEKFREQLLNFK